MVETNGQSDDFQTGSEFSFVRNVQKVYSRQMQLSTENLTDIYRRRNTVSTRSAAAKSRMSAPAR